VTPGRLSIRARLTLWHAGTLALIVLVFSAAMFALVRVWLYRDLDQRLERDLAAAAMAYEGGPEELTELETRSSFSLFEVVRGGRSLYRTLAWQRGGFAAALPAPGAGPRSWRAPDGRTYRVGRRDAPLYSVYVAIDEGLLRRTLETFAAILSIGVPFAAGLALAAGYLLAGRVLAPIGAMADKARRISAHSLAERLPEGNPRDEFGRLAAVLNDALSRVQDSFEQLRRFTADASHELRTPLTAMRSVGEVALQRRLGPEGYRDVIGSMLEEVEHLTRLAENLLALTRAESGAIALQRDRASLGALAEEVADSLRVLAEEKGQRLEVDASLPAFAEFDPSVLRQGLTNLLHNAIKYTPAGGSVRIAVLRLPGANVGIEIRDSGPGIPAAHRERIFERFYRADEARSRDAGGVGLGLAIARWAIEANGGRIELESELGAGSLFRIVLAEADARAAPRDPREARIAAPLDLRHSG